MFAEVLRKRKERKEKIDARPSTLNSTDDDFTKINAKKVLIAAATTAEADRRVIMHCM